MCEDEVIQITESIEQIEKRNLSEKSIKTIKQINSCEDCPNYDAPYIHGGILHCCSYDYKNEPTRTSRQIDELYSNCPVNHEFEVRKTLIKQYGIVHHRPTEYYRGSISIVDFGRTTFESDGYNPNVDWDEIVVFYYTTQEEADRMMELALDYYNKFNLDAPYIPKICYG